MGKEEIKMKRVTDLNIRWQRQLFLLLWVTAAMCCGTLAQAQSVLVFTSVKGNDEATVGDTLEYSVKVETLENDDSEFRSPNASEAGIEAQSDVRFPIVSEARVEYRVPAELEPVSARSEVGECRLADSSTFSCDLGELRHNAKVRVDFMLRARASGAAVSDFVVTGRIFACEFACDVSDTASLTTKIADLVEPLSISPTAAQLNVGDSVSIGVSGGRSPFEWGSDDDDIATVDDNGTVTGRGAGRTTVIVRDAAGQRASADIEVIETIDPLSINSHPTSLAVNDSFTLHASGGRPPYQWGSDDPAIATVSNEGVVTGVSAGTVRVWVKDADADPRQAESQEITVFEALSIAPRSETLNVGESLQFEALGGIPSYTWRSSDSNIASIDDSGRLTAREPGTVQVTVTDSDGHSASSGDIVIAAPLSISPQTAELLVGSTLQFDASGGIGTLTWSVSNSEVASISSDGLLTAKAPGEVTVSVRDAQGNQAVTENIAIAAALRVSPTSASLAVNSTLQLQASGGLEPYQWQSSNPAIGEVDRNGVVTARSPGVVRITVIDERGQRAETGDITVVSGLEMDPRSATLVAGTSQEFSVQGGVEPYGWSVTDAAVASITQRGVLSAIAAGTVRVQISDAIGQTITSDDIRVLSQLTLSPDDGTVSLGGTLQFTAQGGTGDYRWRVSDEGRAEISDSGLLTARAAGTVTVTVSDESGQEVTSGEVRITDGLALSPTTGTVIVGETLQFQGSGGTTPYRWRVSNDELAEISDTGLLSAKRAGSLTVTLADAQNNELTSSTIELVEKLSISPRTATVALGESLTFQPSGGLRPYQWSSSDTSVATIDEQGVLTSLAAGRVRISVKDRSGQSAGTEDIEVRAGLSVAPAQVTVQVDETVALQATGGKSPYRWTSADNAIATVDDAGRVTGKAAGETQIVLNDSDNKEVRVSVTVQTTPVDPPPDDGAGSPPIADETYLVSVYASDANAVESGSSGAFTIFLDRAAEAPGVTVRYSIDDAPRADNDVLIDAATAIEPLPGQITIPTGEISATVVVRPIDNDTADGVRPIVLNLLPGEGYEIANTSGAATLVVIDDDITGSAPSADAASALTIERVEGSSTQSARVSANVAFAVRVLDGNRTPVPGATITWELSERGITAGGQLGNEDQTTDAEGEAGVTLSTGSFPAIYEVTARAALDGTSSASVSFLVNAGLIDIVDPLTPEGALGVTFDSVCPQLQAAASLETSAQSLLDRCTEIYSAFANGEDTALLDALRSLAPEEVAAQGTVGLRFASRQLRNIDERLRGLRRGQRTLSLSGLSFNVNGDVLPGSVFEPSRNPSLQGGTAGDAIGDESATSWLDDRTGVFITGAIDVLEKSRTAQESGLEAETQGVTAGIDRRITDSWVLGTAVGYGATELDLSADGGTLDSDGYSVSGYSSFAWGERIFVDAVLSYGNNDYDLLRNISYTLSTATVQRSARGKTKGAQVSAALSAAYGWGSDGFETELFGRVEHTRANIDAYDESGAAELDLALAEQNLEATYVSLGGSFSRTFSMFWGVLQPQAGLSWERDMTDAYDIQGRFVADPSNTSFRFQSDEPDSDYLRASVGLSAIFAGGITAFVQHESTLQKENFDESALNLGVRFHQLF